MTVSVLAVVLRLC